MVEFLAKDDESIEKFLHFERKKNTSILPSLINILFYIFFANLLYCFCLLFGVLKPVFY